MVGATEREVHPWLRAAGHATRVAPDAKSALTALGEAPADLVIVDRDPGGLDTPDLCRALHADPRLDGAWMLAITAKSFMTAAVKTWPMSPRKAALSSAWLPAASATEVSARMATATASPKDIN